MVERHFLGAAAVAKLTAELGGTDNDRVLSMSTMKGWDFNLGEVFEVSVDRGLASEEKMLCVIGSRNPDGSGTLSVYVDQVGGGVVMRGWDDTVIQRHLVGATVEHVWTATDARQTFASLQELDHRTTGNTWGDLLKTTNPIP